MPYRYHVLAIVIFWLAVTSWLVQREFWPHHHDNAPPPVHIDLLDEAGRHIEWQVKIGDKHVCKMQTQVMYSRTDDTFMLFSSFHPRSTDSQNLLRVPLVGADCMIRITRKGELRGAEAEITLNIAGEEVKAEMKGTVENGRFRSQWEFLARSLGSERHKLAGTEIEIPPEGGILNPLLPVNALKGVYDGQSWEMPVFDPLEDSLAMYLPGDKNKIRYVKAEVHRDPEPLPWRGGRDVCLVIDYRGKDLTARTWVRETDGKVLKQEVTLQGQKLSLERERD